MLFGIYFFWGEKMNLFSVFLVGLGLSMDAFAAAVCKGLAIKKNFLEKSLVIALFFGVFQGLMPYIGYLLGSIFAEKLQAVDHWIAFILLGVIGLNMIREARDKTCPIEEDRLDIKNLFVLAIATSIDALAVGVSFAFLEIKISTCSFSYRVYNFCNIFCRSSNRKVFWNSFKRQGTNYWWNNPNSFRCKNIS